MRKQPFVIYTVCGIRFMYQQNVQTIYIVTRDTQLETGDPAKLPTQLAQRLRRNELKQCTVRKKIFCTGSTRARQDKNLFYLPSPTNQARKGPFNNVLLESPFTSVSNAQQGPPLSSLSDLNEQILYCEVKLRDIIKQQCAIKPFLFLCKKWMSGKYWI